MASNQPIIRIPAENRDALQRYKLRVAADIGRAFPVGAIIGIMVKVCINHHGEVIALAKQEIK